MTETGQTTHLNPSPRCFKASQHYELSSSATNRHDYSSPLGVVAIGAF